MAAGDLEVYAKMNDAPVRQCFCTGCCCPRYRECCPVRPYSPYPYNPYVPVPWGGTNIIYC